MLAKVLKQRRDAERRLEQTSPVPVFNGGAADSVEGGGNEIVSNSVTQAQLTAGLATKSNTDHDHDSDYSAIDHTHEFTDLTDAPASYTGQSGKLVAVKSTEDGLEFVASPDAANGLPSGGTTNQLAAKNSNTDYDVKWVDAPSAANGIPTGGTTEQILSKINGTDYNVHWVDKPSSDSSYQNPIDKPPSSAHAKDDEFADTSLNSKWSWINQGSATWSEQDGYGKMSMLSGGDHTRLLVQTAPSGDFVMTAKIRNAMLPLDYSMFGLCLYNSANGYRTILGQKTMSSYYRNGVIRFTGDTAYSSDRYDVGTMSEFAHYYRIRNVSGTLYYEVSTDGDIFTQIYSETISSWMNAISHVGIGQFRNNTNGVTYYGKCDWFRITE